MTGTAEARRRIKAARRKVDRARVSETAALLELGRALADAPRPAVGGRGGHDALSVDELAQLAGVTTRQAVYDLIRRAEQADAVNESTDSYTRKRGKGR